MRLRAHIAWIRASRIRTTLWIAILCMWVFIIGSWIWIAGMWGWFGECGWFAPKTVEFHQGMTLCPGQSAHIEIRIPLHAPERQDDGI
jgi:hypothetical protein